MARIDATTAISNFAHGMVNDTNLIEYPPNSAEWILNARIRDDTIVERREGMYRVGSLTGSATSSHNKIAKLINWETLSSDSNFQVSSVNRVVTVSGFGWSRSFNLDHFAAGAQTAEIIIEYRKTTAAAVTTSIEGTEWFSKLELFEADGALVSQEGPLTEVISTIPSIVTQAVSTQKFVYLTDTYERRVIYKRGKLFQRNLFYEAQQELKPSEYLTITPLRNMLIITGIGICPVVIWGRTQSAEGTSTTEFYCEPLLLKYREYEDYPDGVGMEEKLDGSVTPPDNYFFNMYNRGWTTEEIQDYKTAKNKWPSKNMVPWAAKDANNEFAPNELDKLVFGSSSAPIGSLIVSDPELAGRPAIVSTTALGRAWYASSTHEAFGSMIYFSQTITSTDFPAEQLSSCYSINDPTAEYLNGALATDGGYITIPEIENIVAMRPYTDGVLIFARNGVWYITGSGGGQFAGNSYAYYKITDEGCVAGTSVVEARGMMVYWSDNGILAITPNAQTRSLNAQSITDGKISTYYKNMLRSKYVHGAYNKEEDSIIWGFSDSNNTLRFTSTGGLLMNESSVYVELYGCNTLRLKLSTMAFTLDRMADEMHFCGISHTGDRILATCWETTDNTTLRQSVFVYMEGAEPISSKALKYRDWIVSDHNSDTYTLSPTGLYDTELIITSNGQLAIASRQIEGVRCAFKYTQYEAEIESEPQMIYGSCLMQVQYDGAINFTTGKWTEPQQVCRVTQPWLPISPADRYPYEILHTKTRVRGRGLVGRVKFKSEDTKDFKLLGYAVDFSVSRGDLAKAQYGG